MADTINTNRWRENIEQWLEGGVSEDLGNAFKDELQLLDAFDVARNEYDDATKLVAERNKQLERVTDLVRYKRHDLHTEGLISDEEYASLVQVPGAVARLEGYDKAVVAVAQRALEKASLHIPGWEDVRDSLVKGRAICSCGLKADGVTRWAKLWADHIIALG